MKLTKRKRAKVVRRVAAGAVAASAVGVAVAGVAVAARRTEQVEPKLPAPGATLVVDVASRGLVLVYEGRRITTGPLEGRATFEIESNKDDPASVRTRIGEFSLTSPAKQGGVTIAVDPADRNAGEHSVLRRDRSRPPRIEHTIDVPLTVTVRYPEILGLPAGTEEPLKLESETAAVLIGELNGFPPKRARYKLGRPTVLSPQGRPGAAGVTLLKFPVKLEGF